MQTTIRTALAAAAMAAGTVLPAAMPAAADTFRAITDRSEFIRLVEGRTLRYPGVRLEVTPQGEIEGRGLGTPVTGSWSWQGNHFCRDLYWGQQEIGYNCQLVLRDGATLRFVSDRGQGRSADFSLQ